MTISKFILNTLDRMVLGFWLIAMIPILLLGYLVDFLETVLFILISAGDKKTDNAISRIKKRIEK